MDSKTTHEGKGIQKEKMINQDGYLVNEEIEDDIEEEGGEGGYVDDEKRKVVYGKQGGNGVGGMSQPSCQVDRCGADLSESKKYHKRHKVCELHAKAPAVVVAGLRQRFCQQCSK